MKEKTGNAGQFKPGQSGNINGRPKKEYTVSNLLKEISHEKGKGENYTKLEEIVRTVVDLAIEGKPWAIQFIADRTEGKPHQRLTVDDDRVPDVPDFSSLTYKQLEKLYAGNRKTSD